MRRVGPFQDLLRSRLAQRGDLARLAEASGLRSPVIARWKEGSSRPTPSNLWRVAPALGQTYEELMRMCGYLPDIARPAQPPPAPLDPRLERLIRHWPDLDESVKDWLAGCFPRTRRSATRARDSSGPNVLMG